MTLRPTGIHTPFGGASWEFVDDEKDNAQALLKYLGGQRILYNSCDKGCRHCAEYSQKSVSQIKDEITAQLIKVKSDNAYAKCLGELRFICNNFLDEQCKIIFIHAFNNKSKCTVIKFRKEVSSYVVSILNMFKINGNSDIKRILRSCEN